MRRTPISSSLPGRRKPWRLAVVVLVVCLGVRVTFAGEVRTHVSRPVESDQARAAASAIAAGGEVIHLRWKLAGFSGFLAGLFLPNHGDGLLTFVRGSSQRIKIQLLITTPKRAGDYYLYGAEIDQSVGSTVAVWSSYQFGNDGKEREQDIDERDIVDFASAIYNLRWNPPQQPTRTTIWSDGETYAVEIKPLRPEKRKIAGKKIDVRGYSVRGVKLKGKDSFNDKFFLYFARDTRSTLVEIVAKRGFARVRFQLVKAVGPAAVVDGHDETLSNDTAPDTRRSGSSGNR